MSKSVLTVAARVLRRRRVHTEPCLLVASEGQMVRSTV